MKIPSRMGNEESKIVAGIINTKREIAVAEGKLYGLQNRYKKFKEQV